MKSLDEINELEQAFWRSSSPDTTATGGLMPAVDSYEERYQQGAKDRETILRLLFLYWYALVEPPYITGLDGVSEPAAKFAVLFEECAGKYQGDVEVCTILGYLISLYPFLLGDEERWRENSQRLLERASQLEPTDLIVRLVQGDSNSSTNPLFNESVNSSLRHRLSNRGCMGAYLIQSLSRGA